MRKAMGKKVRAIMRAEEERFLERRRREGLHAGAREADIRPDRAVRRLRLQQGARRLLRHDRLPDGVPQGELPGGVHDRRDDDGRRPAARRGGLRRVRPAGHPRPAAGRQPQRRQLRARRAAGRQATASASASRRSRTSARDVSEGIIETRARAAPFETIDDGFERVDVTPPQQARAGEPGQGRARSTR